MSKPQRNKPCPCGSGKKFKKCCVGKVKDFQTRISNGETPKAIIVERILKS